MSSENYVGIIMAENLRFLGEGSSAQGMHIRLKFRSHRTLSTLTHGDSGTRALVDPGVRDRNIVGKSAMLCGEKRCVVC